METKTADSLAVATARSAISRADDAQSRYATMYTRFRTLKELPPPLSGDDVHEWFKDVQSDLAKFTGPNVRSQELKKLGILRQQDYTDFNRLFKASEGYEKVPNTKNEVVKAEHKVKQRKARMEFVGNTILPSQLKKKVSGTAAELEILQTVLYHELVQKAHRATAGDDDDSD